MTTVHVMSSMMMSSHFHILTLSVTITSTDFLASHRSMCFRAISSTFRFDKNSHTPSLARIIAQWWLSILNYVISGWGMTPQLWANKSPKLRDIARPGASSFFFHTHAGPAFFPNISLSCSTHPPDLIILCFSSELSGLWSWDNSIGTHMPCQSSIRMALESPTFRQVTVWFSSSFRFKITFTAVVPLMCTSNFNEFIDFRSS